MGWFSDDETGAERAARIRGENQAAEHARKQSARASSEEARILQKWEDENRIYKRTEYKADLDRSKRPGYERQYYSPADVPDMPGKPWVGGYTSQAPAAAPQEEGVPLIGWVIIGMGLVFGVIPMLLQMAMPIIAGILQAVWLVVLSAVGLLVLAWIILTVTAREDEAMVRRARLFNPLRIGTIFYQVIREHLAERRARTQMDA